MKQKTCSQHWKEQKWIEDNRGASLVLVITVISVVVVIASMLLAMTLSNLKMKTTYSGSQKNFYDAESVLDDINTGLQKDVADAAGEAYAWMLENYSDATETERRTYYSSRFTEELIDRVSTGTDDGAYVMHYDLSHLQSMVSDSVKAGATNADSTSTPLVASEDGQYVLNHDDVDGTLTLKNVLVTFVNKRNYMTQIQTDIVLSCPPIETKTKAVAALDLPSYAFVAGNQTIVHDSNTKSIKGNAYLGDVGADFALGTVILAPSATSGKLTSAGQICVRNAAKLSVEKGITLWAHEVFVDGADEVSLKGTTYLNDDLVIDNTIGTGSVNVNLSGRFYAYGNANTAGNAQVFRDDTEEQTKLSDNPASYSSAILINGRNAVLDMSKLDDLILGGTAYVGSEDGTSSAKVQMGESLALKSNQRAYLVPSEYLAPYCVAGGRNPMSESTYNALLQEIKDKRGYASVSDVQDIDFLRYDAQSTTAISQDLLNLHVKGVTKQVYRLSTANGDQNMYYFFLEFDTENDAIAYGETQYADKSSSLDASLASEHYNTSITYPSMMYSEFSKNSSTISDFGFYYNGSLLVPAVGEAHTTVKVGQSTLASTETTASLATREADYQDMFAAMRHTLTSNYSTLSYQQRTNRLYDNLVSDAMTTGDTAIAAGDKRVFTTSAGAANGSKMAAVVVNGDYTLSGSGTDATESVGGASYPVHLVIASGNVTVESNFRGLIIAGGDVTLAGNNITVSASSAFTQQALALMDGDVCPADYLVDGRDYLSMTGDEDEETGGEFSYASYVTYSNWSKQ